MDFTVIQNLDFLYITLWKNFVDTFQVEIISPNGETSGVIRSTERIKNMELGETKISVFNGQPVQYSDDQEILFLFNSSEDNKILGGLWRIIITGSSIIDGKFNAWLPTVEQVTKDTKFLIPNINTTLTLPSTSRKAITVGGFNSIINSLADFSGRGYTRYNVYVKPDIVAPAMGVLSTKAGGGYDSFTGTSAAAPFVAGSVAILMEWGIILNRDPFLYGQRVKGFLRKGANRNQSITYPNTEWGYGRLCLKDTLDYLTSYV